MAFPGFSSQAVEWLRDLVVNNDRDWFNAHKPIYEMEVKQPLLQLVDALNHHLAATLPEYYLDDVSKAPFRIYRDTRFSKNKQPYKTHVSAAFPRRGVVEKASGLYVQIAASGVGIAGGSYMPEPDSLRAIRQRIVDEYDTFEKLVKDKKLKKLMGEMQGESLQRAPKGFPPDHSGEAWLRRKQFYYWVELDPALLTSAKLEKEISKHFEAVAPITLFLDDATLQARKANARISQFLR